MEELDSTQNFSLLVSDNASIYFGVELFFSIPRCARDVTYSENSG